MGKQARNIDFTPIDESSYEGKPGDVSIDEVGTTKPAPTINFTPLDEPVKKKDESVSPSSTVSPAPGKPSKPSTGKSTSTAKPYKYDPTVGKWTNLFRELVQAYNTPVSPEEKAKEKPDPFINAIKRGTALAEQAGILGPTEEKPTLPEIKRVAELQKKTQELPTSDAFKKFNQAETFAGAFKEFAKDPARIIVELSAESLSSMVQYGAARVATGAAIGAAGGTVVAPGPGTIAGAGGGAIVGMADTSLGLEFTGSFMESLQEAGVDTSDPEQLRMAFEDDAVISKARAHAFKKGIPIALFDLVSGGIAGKIVTKPAKSLIGKFGQGAAEFAAQAVFDASGELAGQIVAGEKIQPGAIIGEAIGGVVTTPVEVAVGAATFNKSPQQVVEEQTQDVVPSDESALDRKAEVIQNKVESAEPTVTKGQTDIPQALPQDEATQAAPPATAEPIAEQPISKAQEKAEEQAQAEQEVAAPQDTEVTQNVTDENTPGTKYAPSEQETPIVEPTKQTQDAIQEPSPEEVSARETSGDRPAVGEGVPARETTQESIPQEERIQNEIQTQEELNQPQTKYEQEPTGPPAATEQPSEPVPVNAPNEQIQEVSQADEVVDRPTETQEPPPTPPEQPSGEPIPLEQTPEERTTYTRIKNDPNISETIKQGIASEAKYYVPRDLKNVTTKEADAIIDAKGLDESTKMYLDDDSGIHPDVNTAIGIKLFDRLQTADNFTDAIRVFEKLSVRGTELGQAVNAYKLMQGKTMLNVVNKSIQKARKKFKEKNQWRSQDAKVAIDKINTDAVEKVLKSPKVQTRISSELKKGNVKKAIDFLETLKVETKGKALDAVYGITAAAWNTVITAVQKGLQAGLTISQAINKAVNTIKDPAFRRGEAISYLDDKLKDYRVTLDPGRAIKAELASSGQKIDDIVRQHYSQVASTKKSLIDKLIKDGNVAADQAQAITDELSAEFDRLTRAAKEKALKKLLPKPSKNVTKKEQKDTIDQLIEQSNIGALSEEQYSNAITDKLGVPKLNEAQLKQVQDLTDKVQRAKGDAAKSKAAQDLLNYVENLKGWNWIEAVQAIWYANILSGPTTWLITNPFANLTNLMSELMIDISQNPRDAGFILSRVATGLTRGLVQAVDVLKTGYTPYKGEDYKTEAKPLLERIKFKGGKINPLNWLKYVTRAIKAGDIIFYHPLKEQRLAVLALREARKNKRTTPNKEDMHNLREQLIKEDYDTAFEQASSEGFSGREQKIRAFEILEDMRPEYATKEAENFAARGTFNIKPEGSLGQLAEVINSGRRKLPMLNYVVPFVNTIMNVANEYLNYNPVVGYARVIKGSYGWNSDAKTYRKLTNEERARIAIKATIGAVAMASLALLDDPEDEDGFFEVTANGTGDTLKNFELEKTGWRPYSIRVGKIWIGYKNTPLALPMATIGFMKDAVRYRKEPNISEEISIMAMGSMRFMMDMSTLSGLSDLFEIFSKENISQYGSSAEKLMKNLEKIGKSILVPNYFTQLSRLIQEFTDSPIKRADDIGESVIRDMPVIRDNLDNLYDAFGDPVVAKQLEKFIPLNTHRTPEDAALFEFLKDKKLFIGIPSKQNVKPNGTPMTETEYRTWSLAAAKATKKRLLREYKIYTRQKNREVIQDWFDKVKAEERKEAKRNIFGYF